MNDEQNAVVELPPHLQLELHKFKQGLSEAGHEELIALASQTFEAYLNLHHSGSEKAAYWQRRRELMRRGIQHYWVAIYVVKSATSRLVALPRSLPQEEIVPREILAFQTQFNCLRERKRVELLLLDRLNAFQVDSAVVESVERSIEWLENALNQVLAQAVKWSYEHGYKFHSEPGGARFWVEKQARERGDACSNSLLPTSCSPKAEGGAA